MTPETLYNALSVVLAVDIDCTNTKIVTLFNGEHLQKTVNDYVSKLLDEERPVKFIVFEINTVELKEKMKSVCVNVTIAFPHLYSMYLPGEEYLVFYNENAFLNLALRREIISLSGVFLSVRCLKLSGLHMANSKPEYCQLVADAFNDMNFNSQQYLIVAVDDKYSHAKHAYQQMTQIQTKCVISFLVTSVLPRIRTHAAMEILYKTIGVLTARHVTTEGFKTNGFHFENLDNFESIELVEFDDKNLSK
jgi:hypothetical protein